jgi:hypothetical protein
MSEAGSGLLQRPTGHVFRVDGKRGSVWYPGTPETDNGRSLDFDRIDYTGPSGRGIVSVQASYREDVVEAPDLAAVGEPYYEPSSSRLTGKIVGGRSRRPYPGPSEWRP